MRQPCPYDGKLFHQVPGFNAALGHCPVCHGVAHHVPITVDAITPEEEHDQDDSSIVSLLVLDAAVDFVEVITESPTPDTSTPDVSFGGGDSGGGGASSDW